MVYFNVFLFRQMIHQIESAVGICIQNAQKIPPTCNLLDCVVFLVLARKNVVKIQHRNSGCLF